ncbi:MAG: NAD-dependent epimerase/dehydratase family protein [Lachnospiraceae bacterium]|nr:NAD-dependent epimerase/dehydratase family protein [Lachnospiraceae bacterium]
MRLYDNKSYLEDIEYVGGLELPWDKLQGKTVMISGATGLLGSFLVDVLLSKNQIGLNCTVIALSRNEQKIKERFSKWIGNPFLITVPYDINKPLLLEEYNTVDYVLHLASNTHPVLYSSDPIGTITTNISGLYNMLEYAADHQTERFMFASSNEIYGENRGDVEFFEEDYCGYINSNTLRAGYTESKRCGEALCQAYLVQKGIDVVIPRFTRSYGPTMLMSDTKAISQFIRKGIAGEDIVLKSAGNQYYSYTYVADAVSGLLYVLLKGETGEAYNIADEKSDIQLKDLATLIADVAGTKVVFEIPDKKEAAGYSTATKARLDSKKIKALGWMPRYDIVSGIKQNLSILCSLL